MKMRPAVELSYLDEDSQRDLVDAIDEEVCTPTHAQAIRLRKAFNENVLTREEIFIVMQEEKPNQKDRVILKADTVKDLIPKSVDESKRIEYIRRALQYYGKFLQRQRINAKESR